jgi:hypothetical protein
MNLAASPLTSPLALVGAGQEFRVMTESESKSPPTREITDSRVGWLPAVVAGVVSGLIAWAGGEAADRALTVPIASEFVVSGSQQFAARASALTNKAMVSYGLLGALVGLGLGLIGGRARRSVRGMVVGSTVGAILGAATGALISWMLVPWFVRNERPMEDDLLLPLLTHAGIWAGLGASGGLALGLGLGGSRGRILRAILGGLLGGVVGAVLYEVLGAVLFPLEQTAQPISNGVGSRLFGCLVVAIAIALIAVVASQPSNRVRRASG